MLRDILALGLIFAIIFGRYVNAQTYSKSFIDSSSCGFARSQYIDSASFNGVFSSANVAMKTVVCVVKDFGTCVLILTGVPLSSDSADSVITVETIVPTKLPKCGGRVT